MLLELCSAPNPDLGQTKAPAPKLAVIVRDFAAASQMCRAYIRKYYLSSVNWTGGRLAQGLRFSHRVSYNGRVWNRRTGDCVFEPSAFHA